MSRRSGSGFWAGVILVGLGTAMGQTGTREEAYPAGAREASPAALAPAHMARIGTVDERYQSYNVEMLCEMKSLLGEVA